MEGRPKRSTILEKDYRERKRARRRSSEKVLYMFKFYFPFLSILINFIPLYFYLFFILFFKSVTSPIIQHTEEPVSYTVLERLYKDILQFRDPEE